MSKKRACIVTWYKVPNYGAQLQAIALKDILLQYGYDVSFYNYNRKLRNHNLFSIMNNPFIAIRNYFIKRDMSNEEEFFYQKKERLLEEYGKKVFSIANINIEYDICVVGSDEIFSLADGFNRFQYGDGIMAKRKISYAASFGATTYGMIIFYRKKRLIKKMLGSFDAISVRDDNSLYIINKIMNTSSSFSLDPAFLRDWKDVIGNGVKNEWNVILVYAYNTHQITEEKKNEIKEFAKKNKLEIVSVGYFHPWCDSNLNLTSIQFVEAMYKAKYVITTTFHGTVFSIIFNKNFAVIKQDKNQFKIDSLIREFGAYGHIANEQSIENVLLLNESFESILEQRRNDSIRYIESKFKYGK